MNRFNKLLCLLLISLLPVAGYTKEKVRNPPSPPLPPKPPSRNLHPTNDSSREGGRHVFIPQESVQEVEITFIENSGDIIIQGTEGEQIEIISEDYEDPDYEEDEEADENGFISVFSVGRDNTGFGLSISETDESVEIVGLPNTSSSDFTINVPNKYALKVQIIGNGDCTLQDFDGEIEMTVAEGDAIIRNVTGPATLHNMNGDLLVYFSSVSQDAPTSITNLNGDTVVSIPEDTKANLKMNSLNSDIRTNLNVDYEKGRRDPYSFIGGMREVNGTLNGGGVLIQLESINGDIVLKKSQREAAETHERQRVEKAKEAARLRKERERERIEKVKEATRLRKELARQRVEEAKKAMEDN